MDLSPHQRSMASRLNLRFDSKSEINVGDFMDQKQSLSIEYLLLLLQLGVKLLEVHSVVTSHASEIFAPMVGKLLSLKAEEKGSFRRSWYKLIVNSMYGYFLIKVSKFLNAKLLLSSKAMKRAVESPYLDHFNLVNPSAMVAYFKPKVVPYTTLLPLGVATLLESKRQLVSDYYLKILPTLLSHRFIKSIYPLYIDTGFIFHL